MNPVKKNPELWAIFLDEQEVRHWVLGNVGPGVA